MEMEMTKTILIAEDEAHFKDKYRAWAQDYGYNVVEATSLDEGLERLSQVDAVITDHGLKGGNGNDLARIAKEHKLPVAGISGSGPSVFDNRYVDIPESKHIDERNFKTLLGCLFEENPREAYNKKVKKEVSYELPCAASILFQGYYLLSALNQGLNEVKVDGEVVLTEKDIQNFRNIRRNMPRQEATTMLDMFMNGELNASEVYSIACEGNSALLSDSRLKDVFDRLGKGNFVLSINDAVYASKKIMERGL